MTKDADFVDSHLLDGRPAKLVLISTRNITNADLKELLTAVAPDIERALDSCTFLEVDRQGIIVRK